MAGIYIHIPFCTRKCHYCNFFSLASKKMREPFLRALKTEADLTRDYLGGEQVNTVYFGGGTPSVFRPGELEGIMADLSDPTQGKSTQGSVRQKEQSLISHVNQEITLELNPEDVTEAFVEELRETRFNRFSLGVQSFFDEDLVSLNRSHSGLQAVKAVKLLQRVGYENISIDLIYGIPGSSDVCWKENLETAFSLEVPHISAYALTVEPGTPLAWMIGKHRLAPVNDEAQVVQFKLLMQLTREQGFQQYEISNFAKPGRHAVHNTNYWKGVTYLGLGPSAHSYNGTSRRWNVSNLTTYIASMEKREHRFEEEILTPVQKYNECVMMSLRTMWGWELERRDEGRGTRDEGLRKQAEAFVQKGWLMEQSGIFFLTDEGKLFADGIAAALFVVEK